MPFPLDLGILTAGLILGYVIGAAHPLRAIRDVTGGWMSVVVRVPRGQTRARHVLMYLAWFLTHPALAVLGLWEAAHGREEKPPERLLAPQLDLKWRDHP